MEIQGQVKERHIHTVFYSPLPCFLVTAIAQKNSCEIVTIETKLTETGGEAQWASPAWLAL